MQATIFHYGSVSLIKEPCRSAHHAAMHIAKMCGSILSYAPNLTLPLWPSPEAAREGIMNIWNYADIIKVHVLCLCVVHIYIHRERERESKLLFGPSKMVLQYQFRYQIALQKGQLMSKNEIEVPIWCQKLILKEYFDLFIIQGPN